MPDLEPDYRKERGSSNGKETFYTVEIRSPGEPFVLCGVPVTKEWRQYSGERGPHGVPEFVDWRRISENGRMTYAGAQALRWWFVAESQHATLWPLVQTRLVKHETKYSSVTTAVSYHDEVADPMSARGM